MAATDPQTRLRFPSALKERLEVAARSSNRSFNAEVVARLDQSFEGNAPGSPISVAPDLLSVELTIGHAISMIPKSELLQRLRGIGKKIDNIADFLERTEEPTPPKTSE